MEEHAGSYSDRKELQEVIYYNSQTPDLSGGTDDDRPAGCAVCCFTGGKGGGY